MMKITPAPMRVPTTIFLPVLQPCPTTFTDRTLSKANVSVTILPAFVNCRSNPESVMDPSLPRILCLSASLTSTTEPAGICVNCSFTPCGGAAATWHAPLADAEDDHSSRAVQSRATWFRTIHTSSRHRLNIRVAESGFGYVTLAAPEYTRRTPRGRKPHFRGTTATTLDLPPLLSAPDHILFATTWMTFGSLLWFTGTVMLTVKLRSILSPETVPSYFVVTL